MVPTTMHPCTQRERLRLHISFMCSGSSDRKKSASPQPSGHATMTRGHTGSWNSAALSCDT
jgi:hypothetical protein